MGRSDSHRPDLKELLLKEGVVAQDVLNQVLMDHEKTRRPVLEILIQQGGYDEKKMLQVFTKHYGYPPVNLSIFVIEPELLDLIPVDTAKKYLAVPVSRFGNTLTVAFANPTHLKAIDDMHMMTGMRLKVAVASAEQIKTFIATRYEGKVKESEKSEDSLEVNPEDRVDDLVKLIEDEKSEGNEKSDLIKIAHETPVIKLVNMVLVEGIRRGASDIFVEPWENFIRVRVRVDGLLEEVIRPQKALGEAIVSRIKIMSDLDIAEHRIPQDGRFKLRVKNRAVDMRVSILPTSFGEKVCMRILDTTSQSHEIESLGFNVKEQQIIKDSSRKPHGMILVTGPTGSGKTTTLYSVLKYLDKPEVNITTVEDPVEYQMAGINQVNVREGIGLTFPAALRSILRQDPDIILIGEIRDADTLDIAVKAALTGHLVLSTLHTNDAASSITRMVNMGLEPFLISSTVIMISAQRLVRRLCDRCRQVAEVPPELIQRLGAPVPTDAVFYKGVGCSRCRQTGYRGRTVITELLNMTPDIRDHVMRRASADEIKAYAKTQEMNTLRESAVQKALAGETSIEEIFRVTNADTPPTKKTDPQGVSGEVRDAS